MKFSLALLLAVVCSCSASAISPEQHVSNLRAELAFIKLACDVYRLDPKYPRDPKVTADCDKLR